MYSKYFLMLLWSLLCCVLLFGCAQRIHAIVSATAEVWYAPPGQPIRMGLLLGHGPAREAYLQHLII